MLLELFNKIGRKNALSKVNLDRLMGVFPLEEVYPKEPFNSAHQLNLEVLCKKTFEELIHVVRGGEVYKVIDVNSQSERNSGWSGRGVVRIPNKSSEHARI